MMISCDDTVVLYGQCDHVALLSDHTVCLGTNVMYNGQPRGEVMSIDEANLVSQAAPSVADSKSGYEGKRLLLKSLLTGYNVRLRSDGGVDALGDNGNGTFGLSRHALNHAVQTPPWGSQCAQSGRRFDCRACGIQAGTCASSLWP